MQQDNPKISIVIPVYNVEKYLRRCLDSVLNQTFSDWEAICVNDGSPDKSADILKEYAKLDPRIKVINKDNGGLSDARNLGINFTKGQYIFLLDSDDFIHSQTLEILDCLIESENADMILFDFDKVFYINARKRIIHNKEDFSVILPESKNTIYNVKKIKKYTTKKILFHSTERNRSLHVLRPVRRHCYPVLGLYRRTMIAEIPFVKGIIMEDFPWWSTLLLKRPKTVITKIPLYFYMPNSTSILNSSGALRMIESITTGLEHAYKIYKKEASQKEFKHFVREFLWPFTIIAMRKTRNLENKFDLDVAKKAFTNLYNIGVFDKAYGLRAKKYRRKIKKFIKDSI